MDHGRILAARTLLEEGRGVLLYRLLSPWRRRGSSMLQVGLGTGLMPDFFWEAGFEATGLDPSPEAVSRAAAHTGPRVDYTAGQPDHLPFDDASFDYVALVHQGLHRPDVLNEALRVAARGVIVLEWNRFALTGPGRQAHTCWPWKLLWLAHRHCSGCRLDLRSVILCPPRLSGAEWEEADRPGVYTKSGERPRASKNGGMREGVACVNRLVMPLPVGVLLGLRLEKSSLLPSSAGTVRHDIPAHACATGATVNRQEQTERRETVQRSQCSGPCRLPGNSLASQSRQC